MKNASAGRRQTRPGQNSSTKLRSKQKRQVFIFLTKTRDLLRLPCSVDYIIKQEMITLRVIYLFMLFSSSLFHVYHTAQMWKERIKFWIVNMLRRRRSAGECVFCGRWRRVCHVDAPSVWPVRTHPFGTNHHFVNSDYLLFADAHGRTNEHAREARCNALQDIERQP